MSRHPATEALLQWFSHEHLRDGLGKDVSRAIGGLAHYLADEVPEGGAELSAGLRHLLEAKDCFVRAAILTERSES